MKIFTLDNFFFFLPRVFKAMPVTLQITIGSTIIGTLVGLFISLVRIEKIPVLSQFLNVICSFFKGTSILIQLFIVYFGLPILLEALSFENTQVDRMVAVFIAYGLNLGAFLADTFQSAIEAVPQSQFEAARSLGYSRWQTYSNFIIPQSVRIALPDFGTKIITLLQETAVAFSIGILDMMGIVKSLSVMRSSQLEGYVAATIIFLILSGLLHIFFEYMTKKFSF